MRKQQSPAQGQQRDPTMFQIGLPTTFLVTDGSFFIGIVGYQARETALRIMGIFA
ncbi:MAG: hypothetical protein M3N23_02425 [Pseudomonadota bacterium]|nr:hypothetical protein [Pseudomonadota bacterium]